MKILIATPVFYPMINGVAMFSYNLACQLARMGHEVVVITPSQTGKKSTRMLDGVKVHYLDSTRLMIYPDQIHPVQEKKKRFYKYSLRASIFPGNQIKKIFREFLPDVVHVQGADPVGLFVSKYARKNHIPVVATEHNQPEVLTEPLHLFKFIEKPTNKALSKFFIRRLKKSDFATMPTELSLKVLLNGKDIGVPVKAISNGVDLTSFRPGKTSDNIYNIYNIPKDVPIILYIGRLDPEKKVGTVIKSFADFLEKHKLDKLSKTLFVIAGDGVDKNNLVNLARKLKISDSVRFLGKVTGPDLYDVYRMGDVFATASEIETQGIVLIEAAATGLPLIAVDGGAVAEVCQNKVNGFLVEPGDIHAIAQAMSDILSNDALREEMAKRSIEIASDHSLEVTAEKFIEIYNKVINRV